jgi:hypothetical protein
LAKNQPISMLENPPLRGSSVLRAMWFQYRCTDKISLSLRSKRHPPAMLTVF